MRPSLESVLEQAQHLPAEDLPRLLGDLREVEAVALARLSAPTAQTAPDQSLSLKEAAERLGMSRDYLYRHWREYRFARQEGRKILFSSNGLDGHLRKAR